MGSKHSFTVTAESLRLMNLFPPPGGYRNYRISWDGWMETNAMKSSNAIFVIYYYLQALANGRRFSKFPHGNQVSHKLPQHYHLPKAHMSPVTYLPLGPRYLTLPSPYTSAIHLAPCSPVASRTATLPRNFLIST